MKTKIFVILLAGLTGLILSFPILVKSKKEENILMYILQIGAFEAKENAFQKQTEYPNSIIYKDNDLYRVIIGASTDQEALEKMKDLVKNEQINFYQKQIQISSENEKLLQDYNLLLKNATDEDTIRLLNQKILEKMVNV